jgi:hypothetical protein
MLLDARSFPWLCSCDTPGFHNLSYTDNGILGRKCFSRNHHIRGQFFALRKIWVQRLHLLTDPTLPGHMRLAWREMSTGWEGHRTSARGWNEIHTFGSGVVSRRRALIVSSSRPLADPL